jgi:hypothetical protein
MRKHTVPLLTAVFLFFSCPVDSGGKFKPEQLVRTGIAGDLMGMVHAGSRYDKADDEYALLDTLGVQWMLTDFSWSDIENSEGAWTWSKYDAYVVNGKSHGKKILAILDYDVEWIHDGTHDSDGPGSNGDDPFADGKSHKYIARSEIPFFVTYVKKTVRRYQNLVDAWCIWNEPNLSDRFWRGTMEEFFELTKAAAAAIREVDPDAFIIGGAFNTLASEEWVRGIFTSGAMAQIDAIAYHPYMTGPGPTVNVFNKFKRIVADYDFEDKIWVTEVGYPTYNSPSIPSGRYGTDVLEANMPETVMQTIVLLTAEGARRIFWYHLFDPSNQNNGDSEDWFGLVKNDFTLKGGAEAYRLAAQYIPGAICKTPERHDLSDLIQAYYFEGYGRHALVVWNTAGVVAKDVRVYLPGTNQKVHDLATGEAKPIEKTSTYTLKSKDGVNNVIQFFTWDNPDPSQPFQPPRISVP